MPAIYDNLGESIHTLELKTYEPIDVKPSTANKVYMDALELPSPFSPSENHTSALNRLNHYRSIAGIPPAVSHQAIYMAAQSHANFYANHANDPRMQGLGAHSEFTDLSGYTGSYPGERVAYFGYPFGAWEVMGFGGDAVKSIDGWIGTVYHRMGPLHYAHIEIGYGIAVKKYNKSRYSRWRI